MAAAGNTAAGPALNKQVAAARCTEAVVAAVAEAERLWAFQQHRSVRRSFRRIWHHQDSVSRGLDSTWSFLPQIVIGSMTNTPGAHGAYPGATTIGRQSRDTSQDGLGLPQLMQKLLLLSLPQEQVQVPSALGAGAAASGWGAAASSAGAAASGADDGGGGGGATGG